MKASQFAALASALACFALPARAQWTVQPVPTTASFRGLSPVNDTVAWASGTGGTFLWTSNGGAEWHVGTVPGATAFDFRAVHAVSLDTAYLMVAAQDTARIYYTADRGAHWTMQFDSVAPGLFFDALAFFDRTHALVLGDPADGHFMLMQTTDGVHWNRLAPDVTPTALPNEAAFAASGTALVTVDRRHAWFATGGGRAARVFRTTDGGKSWTVSETPVAAGSASRGIFSLAFADTLHGVAVGGDYATPNPNAVAAAYTDDGGVTWKAVPPTRATAYLSGAAYLQAPDNSLIAVGTPGTAVSTDSGHSWRPFASQPFNTVMRARHGTTVWAVGEGGAIARLSSSPSSATPGH
jgi:photosystem II stability/assembly factor-like uncharacterized protein